MPKPFVLKNVIDQWPALSWTPEVVGQALVEKRLRVRLGPRKHSPGSVLWETDSINVEASLDQMLTWCRGGEIDQEPEDYPFAKYSPKDYWAYIDYKYMFDLFDDPKNDKYLKDVNWGRVFECGLGNRDGLDSTLWMGTAGAYTPCHYDTYGFNLVAQLYGRKRWILFPPHDDLCSTRLPYEESSVFSSLDFISPTAQQLRHSHPHLVILEAGDVLFVPPKWWHFVQSISDDFTISVNTWIDTPADDREAKSIEALTQVIMALLTTAKSSEAQKFIIEDANSISPMMSNPLDVKGSLDLLNAVVPARNEADNEENTIMNEFLNRWRPVGIEVQPVNDIDEFCRYMTENAVLDITPLEEGNARTSGPVTGKGFEEMDVLKAVTHPDSVRVICGHLMRAKMS